MDSDSSDCAGTDGFAGSLFVDSDDGTSSATDSDASVAAPPATEVLEYPTAKGGVVKVAQRKRLGIGHQVWPAATKLCAYLAEHPLPSGATVLELGAGVGLVGLALAADATAPKVVLTDLEEVLPTLRASVELNAPDVQARAAVAPLAWGSADVDSAAVRAASVVVAADVVYDAALYEPLASTLEALLLRGNVEVAYVAHCRRWKRDVKFFRRLGTRLSVEVVDEDVSHDADGRRTVMRVYCIRPKEAKGGVAKAKDGPKAKANSDAATANTDALAPMEVVLDVPPARARTKIDPRRRRWRSNTLNGTGFEDVARWDRQRVDPRWALVLVAWCQSIFATGLLFGWPALLAMLRREGYYGELCSARSLEEGNCVARTLAYGFAFSVGTAFFFGSSLVAGPALDKFGPRSLNVSAAVLVTLGLVLLAVADSGTFDSLPAACACIGLGGASMHLTFFHTAGLFPRPPAVQVCFVSALVVGGFVWPALDGLVGSGAVGRRIAMLAHALLVAVSGGLAWAAVWPNAAWCPGDAVRWSVGAAELRRCGPFKTRKAAAAAALRSGAADASPAPPADSLKEMVLSYRFMAWTSFGLVSVARWNFYIMTALSRIERIAGVADASANASTRPVLAALKYTIPAGALALPLIGRVNGYDLRAGLAGCSAVGFAFTALASLPSLQSQYVTFATVAVYRVWLFSCLWASSTQFFPPSVFGRIHGISTAVVTLCQPANYLFLWLVEGPLDGNYMVIDVGLAVLALPVAYWNWDVFSKPPLNKATLL